MAFVVDGSEWQVDKFDSPEAFVSALDSLVARVNAAIERDEMVWIGDDLQSKPIFENYDLWSLSEAGINLPVELMQELAGWLGRAQFYIDDENWPAGFDSFEVVVAGELIESADVSWVHHCVLVQRPIACLGLMRTGVLQTESAAGAALVHWVRDEVGHVGFWRDVIATNDSEVQLQRYAANAFPSLFFGDNVWRGIGDFKGGYRAVSMKLRRALSVLNDHGRWVFTTPPPNLSPNEPERDEGGSPTNLLMQQRFTGLGLTVSPEAIEVRLDGTSRRARELLVKGRTLFCEWHEKFEPHQNRIYFHPPVEQSDNKVVIGFFTNHLPLPGD
ncbi:hypothetical protein H4F99_10400 [Lysobacter sp. SG-8]|uniref:Uncharacterized protein n=1 Tax=Marilutibacter penaei TaxID=2759900 RepID=A0A7W3U5D3_9GAMM|nr:hypothetical protein [Lysobacter penaei]MBB1088900.1 hypothetical protein [Lysobacter penaei]